MNREQDAERKHAAWDLRIRGKTYRQIGAELGIGHGTAERWVKEVMANKSIPLAEEVRKQEIDRLSRYLDVLDAKINDGDEKSVSLAIKVSERLCKMLGADVPVVQTVEHVEKAQIDKDIQSLLDEMSDRNKAAKELAARKGIDVESGGSNEAE